MSTSYHIDLDWIKIEKIAVRITVIDVGDKGGAVDALIT